MSEIEQLTIVDYKKIDFDNLSFCVPEKTINGSHIAYAKYQGTDLFIQTPRLNCTQILKNDTRCSLELEFDKAHGLFYEYITSIDDFNVINIQKHSKQWFGKEIPLDIVEEFYKTPVKMGRKNKPPTLKIKVPLSKGEPVCTVYDANNNETSFSRLKQNSKTLVVLKFLGLKFLTQQVLCEWLPVQIKSYYSKGKSKKNLYIIRDNLLTDDERESSKKAIVELVKDNIQLDAVTKAEVALTKEVVTQENEATNEAASVAALSEAALSEATNEAALSEATNEVEEAALSEAAPADSETNAANEVACEEDPETQDDTYDPDDNSNEDSEREHVDKIQDLYDLQDNKDLNLKLSEVDMIEIGDNINVDITPLEAMSQKDIEYLKNTISEQNLKISELEEQFNNFLCNN